MVEIVKNKISDRRNIFLFVVGAIALSLAFYALFFAQTIFNTLGRQNNEKSIASLQSEVEKLEAQYFDLKAGITSSLAESKGFTGISSVTYISRKSLGKVLTLNNEI